jgi:muramoyltetrapeptide carboxypeptidase LdcA involved in peptidoglycan recycling
MKKIALINLCTYEDISTWSSFNDDISFLKNHSIPFVDYASGKSSKNDLFGAFKKALEDENVSAIWFVCGGNRLIEHIDSFDWNKIAATGKKFLGISDFTHFSILASQHKITSYYGVALKKISKYFTEPEQVRIANFLKKIISDDFLDAEVYQIKEEEIMGGHLLCSIFMIDHFKLQLGEKHLFIEYHNIPGESIDDLLYHVHQLGLILKKNTPKSLILGHSMMSDAQGNLIDYGIINASIKKVINDYVKIPASEVDHFNIPIKFD